MRILFCNYEYPPLGGGGGVVMAALARELARRRHAVTVLTSYNQTDMEAAGYKHGIADLVAIRARQAKEIGVDGIVCSPEEVAAVREIIGDRMALVTPGIRPAGSDAGDQKRIMTPSRAIKAGSDYLVVGRPIMEAADPKAAADAIVAEIAQALG